MIDKIYDLHSFDKQKILEEMQKLHDKVNRLAEAASIGRINHLDSMLTKCISTMAEMNTHMMFLTKVTESIRDAHNEAYGRD